MIKSNYPGGKNHLLILGLILTTCLFLQKPLCGQSREIDFVEDFVLGKDRAAALEKLIPGTEQFYYYYCLHYQNTEQFGKVDDLLKVWVKRHGRTRLVKTIENRQALLIYSQDSKKTLDYLKRELNLRFDHQREIPKAERKLPTQLDQALISFESLSKKALRDYLNLDGFKNAGLERLTATDLNNRQLKNLLQRLTWPDSEKLVDLVDRELSIRDAQPFGSMNIHRQMTLSQLDQLVKKRPRLLNETNFVNVYLAKLKPNADQRPALAKIDYDEPELEAYLQRLRKFTDRLAPVHNSLKATVIYHQLKLQRAQGKYDKKLFQAYIELPRQLWYVNPKYIERVESRRHIVDINARYMPIILLPPIGNDEPLIRAYVHHFFKAADDWKEFDPWIRDTYLKQHFAETKIVNGLGDIERWASLLSPEQYKQLINRVDLEFAATNPKTFLADQKVKFDLHVKNVSNLIVKVFEINTENYYKKFQREIDTDINLDGLVPNWEKTFKYSDPPVRRIKREFELDSIAGPGVYVVDFIGNGISSRALIRKGHLQFVAATTAAGQSLTVYDWNNKKLKNASARIAGRKFDADDDGIILLPFATQPGRKPIIISHDNLSSLDYIDHAAETYQLIAGFYVDRESLLRNHTSNVTIRPTLNVSGVKSTLSLLKNVTLNIRAVNQDGIVNTQTINHIDLKTDGETEIAFGVPARLIELSFALTADVENISQATTQTVAAAQKLKINLIDKTTLIRDIHLTNASDGYVLEVRGKNGTPLAKQAVLVSLSHRMFKRPVVVSLQTNDSGQIELGELKEIETMEATMGNVKSNWPLPTNRQTQFQTINGIAGDKVQIPYPFNAGKTRRELALFEIRDGVFVRDAFEAIEVGDGRLVLKELAPGNYQLILKSSNQSFLVRITDGQRNADVAFSKNRNLELRNRFPLLIENITPADDKISIQLGNASKNSRVHVFASHYQPRFDAFQQLQYGGGMEPFVVDARTSTTSYVVGRNIGDEYRYILDRKYVEKFAGNMLTRPSLLIRPWSIDSADNAIQAPRKGSDFDRAGVDPSKMPKRAERKPAPVGIPSDASNLDFLANGSTLLLNLQPDENGEVTINRDLLKDHYILQIIAIDRQWTSQHWLQLDETPVKLADLKLEKPIDPNEHYALRKEETSLADGGEIVIADDSVSKLQSFDDLGDVFQSLQSLSGNSTLAEFRFILNWPEKTADEKRTLYSKYACHELNFFLFKKDKPFFNNVVKPFIENKRDKTFMDRWLLEQENETDLTPWQFNRLNITERVLLGQRIDENREAIMRNIFDLYQLNPTPPTVADAVFFSLIQAEQLAVNAEPPATDAPMSRPSDKKAKSEKEGDLEKIAGLRVVPQPTAGGRGRRKADGKILDPNAIAGKKSAPGKPSGRLADDELESKDEDGEIAGEKFGDYSKRLQDQQQRQMERLKDMRKNVSQLYRRVEPTKVWVETNYYRLPIGQHLASRVEVNRFWRDYAQFKGGSDFLSPHFAECTGNFTEMMLALSVLDLPFKAKEHGQKKDDNKIVFTAAGPVIVFYQHVKPVVFERRGSTVLVSENFFRNDDRYQTIDGKRYDKFVTGEFLTHVLYGGQVVVTNPTSTPRTIDVLTQIPAGSLPINGSLETRSGKIDLAAFSTRTFEYYFYFPAKGTYQHYPAHVADSEKILAVAAGQSFEVLDQPKKIDKTSWAFISQNGPNDAVIDFLSENNTLNIDLSKIAFRLRDKTFFREVIATLSNRFSYDPTLWSYAIYHDDQKTITQYLKHRDAFLAQCGSFLKSELIEINPIDRYIYEHREFWPLFNARRHKLGSRRQINNDKLWVQYHKFLHILSCKNEMNAEENLAVTYYLLLQDRVREAIGQFAKVNRDSIATKMQYDYCDAYIAMYQEDTDRAKSIATRYQQFPVKHWREHFQNVLAQVTEIESGKPAAAVNEKDREQKLAQQAAKTPTFEFEIESQTVKLRYQNLEQVTVKYYKMDIELLFSRNPFVKSQSEGFAMIRPNLVSTIDLPKDKDVYEFGLPKELANQNVLIEISAAGQTKSSAMYSHSLDVKIAEDYGQLQVKNVATEKPMAKVYVKVYAKMKDGSVKFYKDGYTDLRGRFDYSSLSNQPLDNVARFSILIFSENDGALVRQAGLPAE